MELPSLRQGTVVRRELTDNLTWLMPNRANIQTAEGAKNSRSNNPMGGKKWVSDLNRHFPKEDQMLHKYTKHSAFLSTAETQIRMTL